jgi:hypothetical protein
MKRLILAAASGLCMVGLAGCVTTQPPAASSAPAVQAQTQTQAPACVQNFAKTGSSLMPSGTRYSTQALITGVSRDDAMSRAAAKIAQDGLDLKVMDRVGGLITASNKVIGGRANRDDAGLVANFTNVPRGVRVRLDFKMTCGQAASDSNMQDNLCGVINAILTGG